jgi:hypothetical protein
MEEVVYKILNRINISVGPVTWYQLDRMLSSNNLHNYLANLPSILDKLESDELITQRENNGKPKKLSLTGKGLVELTRLGRLYNPEK